MPTTIHGVFLNVFSIGTLITGESGSGKSSLALSLIDRGHQLIADDAPEFKSIAGSILGACPPQLQDFLSLPSLGVVNIRSLYGKKALHDQQILSLVIHLTDVSRDANACLNGLDQRCEILGHAVPQIPLPKNDSQLAILVEIAAKNHALEQIGYNAKKSFKEQANK